MWTSFREAQKIYAVVGALFIPLLAAALLILNGRADLVGERYRNSLLVRILLAGALLFFLIAGGFQIHRKLFS